MTYNLLFVAETVLALLRHPDYCISAYSSVSYKLLLPCLIIFFWLEWIES